MAATVRQIAARANVSPSTVSRALNNYPYVDDATRACVLEAARELGYAGAMPRPTERPSCTVHVLVREIGASALVHLTSVNPGMHDDIWRGMHGAFERRGVTPHLWGTSMNPQEARRYVTDLGVAGLVFMGGVVNRDLLRELQNVRMPFVVVGAHTMPLVVNCVAPDYLGGMQSVIEHFASSGRRRIGFVNGPPTTTSSEEKYRGLRLGLALRDLPFLQAVTVAGEFEAEAGYAATRDLLDRWTDLDAIAYASDSNALGGLRALAEAGRRVPDDIAVTGFYNYDVSRFTDPPLTTVHQDWVLAGELAARRLCMMMEDHDAQAWCVMIPTSLMVRDSSQVFGPRGQAVLTASSRVDRHSFYSLRREQNERQGTVTA